MSGAREVTDSVCNCWLPWWFYPYSKLLTHGQDSDLEPGSYASIKRMGFLEVPLLKMGGWDVRDKQGD